MNDRSRQTLTNILCGCMTDMRPATDAEKAQYRNNTGTAFDLLAVGKNVGVAEAHVACPAFAGSFDFDRIKRYEKPWFDMRAQDLLNGTPLSEIYPGRNVSDPYLAKAVETVRENAPEYAGKLAMHGSAFPTMVLDMAADYIDRATFEDQTLSLDKAKHLQMFIHEMTVLSEPAGSSLSSVVLDQRQFSALRNSFDEQVAAFEHNTINQLVEEIDLSSVPLPGR